MSFVKLKDLRDRFEREWINGDFKFGYLSDVNADHDITYPLLLVTPPNSNIPDDVRDMADYEFEIHLFKPYYQNQAGSLDVVFDLLEQEGLSWLQSVLDSYSLSEVILSGDIAVERKKEAFNDKLLQVSMSFTLNTFRKAFGDYDKKRIMDFSPSLWLRSDLGVQTTFSGGSEVVKSWKDQSGNGNHFSQATTSKQPLFKYEDALSGQPYVQFDGSNDFLSCVNGGMISGGLNTNLTIIIVSNSDSATSTVFQKSANSGSALFKVEIVSGVYGGAWSDADGDAIRVREVSDAVGTNAIRTFCAHTGGGKVAHYNINGTQVATDNESDFDSLALGTNNAATLGGDGSSVFSASRVSEVIIFGTPLDGDQLPFVENYLKHKYGI